MAIDITEIQWAENTVTDPVTGAANKQEPTTGVKGSGLVRDESLLRDNLNYQFSKYAEFLGDLQTQIDNLVLATPVQQAILEQIYHVGSHYLSDDPQSPADRFGFGTWSQIKGKFITSIDENDTQFDGVGEVGGSKTHSHTNTFSTGAAGDHLHTVSNVWSGTRQQIDGGLPEPSFTSRLVVGSGKTEIAEKLESLAHIGSPEPTTSAGSHTHSIQGGIDTASSLPPYRTLYWWTRTA